MVAWWAVVPSQGRWLLSEITSQAKANPFQLVRIARTEVATLAEGGRLLSWADPDIPGSDKFLRAIGFRPIGSRVYEL